MSQKLCKGIWGQWVMTLGTYIDEKEITKIGRNQIKGCGNSK